MDGDGFPDVIAASSSNSAEGLVWYRYPSWSKHQIANGTFTTDMQVADVDNDGDLDVVITKGAGRGVSAWWYENPRPSGNPESGPWREHKIGDAETHDVEVGDINNDGKIDVVVRNGPTTVFFQKNPDEWVPVVINTRPFEGSSLGDIDGDGDLDIAINGYWLENPLPSGDPASAPWREHRFADGWPTQVAVHLADVNHDGRPDILIAPAETSGRLSWYEGPVDPRSGVWTEHVIDPSISYFHTFKTADMDKDGNLDVVTAKMHQSPGQHEVSIYFNKGGGLAWTQQIVATSGSHNLRVADIGNDGDMDIIGANWQGHTIEIWENLRNDNLVSDRWHYIQVDSNRSERAFGLVLGDMTGDGLADIAAGQYFYRNPGEDMTAAWPRVTLPNAVDAVLLVDVDGDSRASLIGEKLPDVYWLKAMDQQGTAWSAIPIGSLPPTSHGNGQGYATAQIVAGGRPEILLSSGEGIFYFEIPGTDPQAGNWPRTQITPEASQEGIGVGDIDNDGNIDIAAAAGCNPVAWWKNPGNGKGGWQKFVVGTTQYCGDRFAVADINGDGRLDIVVTEETNFADAGVYWFEQPAAGDNSGWKRHTLVTQHTTNSMDVADMDGDGDMDIITAEHRGTKNLSIWENVDHGKFWIEHVVSKGIESHLGARVADMDGDGDKDIVSIAWDDYQFLHLWRNDAIGPGPAPTPGPNPTPNPNPNPSPGGGGGSTQTSAALVAQWSFDEGAGKVAADLSGNGNQGRLVGPTWTTGKVGNALSFNGSGDYVDVGTFDVGAGGQGNDGLTLAAWFRANSFVSPSGDNRIISKATGPEDQDHYWMLSTIQTDAGIRLRFRLKTDGQTATLVANSGDISTGKWMHAAATYDGSRMTIFLDGVEVGSMAKTGAVSSNATVPVWIGGNPGGYRLFDGAIDEVRVYSGALEPESIRTLAEARPLVRLRSVVNGASYLEEISPGSWVTVFGDDLAPVSRVARAEELAGGMLPTELEGVSVRINGNPAPVWFVSPTQLNVLAPDDQSEGPVTVEVIRDGSPGNKYQAQLHRFAPAFFVLWGEGRSYAAATHEDGTLVGRPGVFQGAPSARPAKAGEVISLFGTGFGPTDPPVSAGHLVSAAVPLINAVTIHLGDTVGDVQFAGLSGAGLYQFNLVVPAGLASGDVPVVAEIEGAQSQTECLLAVEQ